MSFSNWYAVWYEPESDDIMAYISMEKIAVIGGAEGNGTYEAFQINQGNAILSKWCRVNCKSPGKPVNVRGEPAWAFKDAQDALLFKLTWG